MTLQGIELANKVLLQAIMYSKVYDATIYITDDDLIEQSKTIVVRYGNFMIACLMKKSGKQHAIFVN